MFWNDPNLYGATFFKDISGGASLPFYRDVQTPMVPYAQTPWPTTPRFFPQAVGYPVQPVAFQPQTHGYQPQTLGFIPPTYGFAPMINPMVQRLDVPTALYPQQITPFNVNLPLHNLPLHNWIRPINC